MENEKEILVAWEIWNLLNKLIDLLWDRYEEGFLNIYDQQETSKFLLSLQTSKLTQGEEDPSD